MLSFNKLQICISLFQRIRLCLPYFNFLQIWIFRLNIFCNAFFLLRVFRKRLWNTRVLNCWTFFLFFNSLICLFSNRQTKNLIGFLFFSCSQHYVRKTYLIWNHVKQSIVQQFWRKIISKMCFAFYSKLFITEVQSSIIEVLFLSCQFFYIFAKFAFNLKQKP